MAKVLRAVVSAMLLVTMGSGASLLAEPQAQPNPLAVTLVDFKDRLNAYVALRDKLGDRSTALKKTDDAADTKRAQQDLAARIQTARAGAKHGDIFSPEIQALFRKLLRPEADPATKSAIKDDNPGPVPFKVNAPYPDKASYSTVPPNVLAALPELPKDIEYRFAGKHLLLRDVRANLIVDFMLNAIP